MPTSSSSPASRTVLTDRLVPAALLDRRSPSERDGSKKRPGSASIASSYRRSYRTRASAPEPTTPRPPQRNVSAEHTTWSTTRPFLLYGSEAQVIEKLTALREEIGISHYVVRDAKGFAPIVAALDST